MSPATNRLTKGAPILPGRDMMPPDTPHPGPGLRTAAALGGSRTKPPIQNAVPALRLNRDIQVIAQIGVDRLCRLVLLEDA